MANVVSLFGGEFTPPSKPVLQAPELQFMDAIASAGIDAPESIIMDGKLHRFSTNGKRKDDSGWYVCFDGEVPAGRFGCWRSGIEHNWRADIGRELSIGEQMEHQRRTAEAKAVRDRELAEKRQTAADTAEEMWQAAAPASEAHPYLMKKAISADGMRVAGDGRLIIPMYDAEGEMVGAQLIGGDGSKFFIPGSKAGGAMWLAGSAKNSAQIYIAEGVATAKTVAEETGQPCFASFSAGNLLAVSRAIRDRFGLAAQIIIIADNDESGTGQREAQKAAEAIGARVVMPPIVGMDANDFRQSGGDLMALINPPCDTGADDWLIPADDFCAAHAPVSWLIKRHLQREALIMVHGPSGGGKTFVVLDMCLHLAAGKTDWHGWRVTPGAVVYLAGEGHQGLRSRIAAWKKQNDAGKLDMWLSKAGVDLNTPEGFRVAREAILALPHRPAIIVVDTLHRFLNGDENSAQDAKTMLDACGALMREFNCSVLLVHHTGVSDEAQHRARGSSAWRGALEIEFSVIPAKEKGMPLELVQRKSKDAELVEPMFMQLKTVELDWIDEDGERVTSAVAVKCDEEESAVHSRANESKTVAKYRRMFEDAWLESCCDFLKGAPFLSAGDWQGWFAKSDFPSDASRRKELSRAKKELMQAGLIGEQMGGYVVIDESMATALGLLKN